MRSSDLLFSCLLMLMLALSGCGGDSKSNAAVAPKILTAIAVTPAGPILTTGKTLQFTATGTFSDGTSQDLTSAAAWSSADIAVATISSSGVATAVAAGSTTISATSGAVASSTKLTVTAAVTAAQARNVMPITVNGSLCSPNSYPNKPCVSVTVCIPGTSTCTTVDDILLDTGSFGLRLFKQPLGFELPAAPGAAGTLAECIQFADGSSEWGPVRLATVTLGNEPAIDIPIHVFDTSFATRPAACLNADMDPATAGFKGILGVGLFPQDCGERCANSAANGMYFSCTGAACSGTSVAVANQVKNPVAFLPQDNNGVLVKIPDVPPGGVPSVDGSLILGIGTQPNNTPGAVIPFAVNQFGEITTVFNGLTNDSFIDTGSNGLFFPQPTQPVLPICTPPFGAWYCPPTEVSLTATTIAAAGTARQDVPFSIGNFSSLTGTGNRVFDNIGGPAAGHIFDWGFPFFLGRDVFVGIEGKGSSLGNGPFWAY